jgi:hypothetical protein
MSPLGPKRRFTAAPQNVGNAEQTGRSEGAARTAGFDPSRTLRVHRSTHEVALNFERLANVKLATDRHGRA